MFTGLIEAVGKVVRVNYSSVSINAYAISERVKKGDSIAVNGICLTAKEIDKGVFTADISLETFSKTTMKNIKVGQRVNLETAMSIDKLFGGHILQGHVDCIGKISSLRKSPNGWDLFVAVPLEFAPMLVERGSIGIDGASLTIAEVLRNKVKIALIPHTIENTIIQNYTPNNEVNIEFDIIGKYVQRYLQEVLSMKEKSITIDKLKEMGFDK